MTKHERIETFLVGDEQALETLKDYKQAADGRTASIVRGRKIQKFMHSLNQTVTDLASTYQLSEEELKQLLMGKVKADHKILFDKIYYDLAYLVEGQIKAANEELFVTILKGDFFRDKTFYRLLRQQLAVTQEEFAKTLKVSTSKVRKWEQGKLVASGPDEIVLFMIIPERFKAAADLDSHYPFTDSQEVVEYHSDTYGYRVIQEISIELGKQHF